MLYLDPTEAFQMIANPLRFALQKSRGSLRRIPATDDPS